MLLCVLLLNPLLTNHLLLHVAATGGMGEHGIDLHQAKEEVRVDVALCLR
jgi:hypothetical protein